MLADPMIFAAASFLKTRQYAVQRQRAQAIEIHEDAKKDLAELTEMGIIRRWAKRKKIADAKAQVAEISARVTEIDIRARDLSRQAEVMLGRLNLKNTA